LSFLWVTIPISLGLGLALLVFVIRAAKAGEFEDWEGPAFRMLFDDDSAPEIEGECADAKLVDATPRHATHAQKGKPR